MPELTTETAPLTTEEVVAATKQLNYGTWRFQRNWNPMHIVDAEGCYFIDAAGKRYLDFSSQLMCVNLGHKNPAVIQRHSRTRPPPSLHRARICHHRPRRAEQALLEVLPAGLEKFFFTTSGTEANEAAFKIARMYTGKTKIIARYRSYHGSTMASIAATGDPRRWAIEPGGKGQGVIFAPEVNCYDCPIRAHLPRLQHRLRRLPRTHDRATRATSPPSSSSRSSAPTACWFRRPNTCRACATSATDTASC